MDFSPRQRKQKKRVLWTPEAENILLKLWELRIGDLRSNRRNSHILEEMQESMTSRGFVFNTAEIKFKIHNFTNRYREEKRKAGKKSTWPYFIRIHGILGTVTGKNMEDIMEDAIEDTDLEVTTSQSYQDPLDAVRSSTDSSAIDIKLEEEPAMSCSEPVRKRPKRQLIPAGMLTKINATEKQLSMEMKELRENDRRIVELQEELVSYERKRCENMSIRNNIFEKGVNLLGELLHFMKENKK